MQGPSPPSARTTPITRSQRLHEYEHRLEEMRQRVALLKRVASEPEKLHDEFWRNHFRRDASGVYRLLSPLDVRMFFMHFKSRDCALLVSCQQSACRGCGVMEHRMRDIAPFLPCPLVYVSLDVDAACDEQFVAKGLQSHLKHQGETPALLVWNAAKQAVANARGETPQDAVAVLDFIKRALQ